MKNNLHMHIPGFNEPSAFFCISIPTKAYQHGAHRFSNRIHILACLFASSPRSPTGEAILWTVQPSQSFPRQITQASHMKITALKSCLNCKAELDRRWLGTEIFLLKEIFVVQVLAGKGTVFYGYFIDNVEILAFHLSFRENKNILLLKDRFFSKNLCLERK